MLTDVAPVNRSDVTSVIASRTFLEEAAPMRAPRSANASATIRRAGTCSSRGTTSSIPPFFQLDPDKASVARVLDAAVGGTGVCCSRWRVTVAVTDPDGLRRTETDRDGPRRTESRSEHGHLRHVRQRLRRVLHGEP